MAKDKAGSIGDTTLIIYKELSQHPTEDQVKILVAVQALLGTGELLQSSNPDLVTNNDPPLVNVGGKPAAGGGRAGTAEDYFAKKAPENKIEELAVAAHFLEKAGDNTAFTKEALQGVIESARRNFDSHNFARDIGNAKTKGLFNKGGKSKEYSLSFYGKNFIDALPDREVASAIRVPKKSGGRKKASKKAGKKTAAQKK